jgi:hypothetical protein
VFSFHDTKGQTIDPNTVQVVARRKNLAGDGKLENLKLSKGAATMLPGRWDIALAPNPKYYAENFEGPSRDAVERGRADGWNEIGLSGYPPPDAVSFRLSSTPGTLHGMVTASGHDPVPGAPVYLELYDVDVRKRPIDVRETRTDIHGQYQFFGLAPGHYRVVGTFEFLAPDSATNGDARPQGCADRRRPRHGARPGFICGPIIRGNLDLLF